MVSTFRPQVQTRHKGDKQDIRKPHDRGADTGTRKWQRLASDWIHKYPLCVLCLVRGTNSIYHNDGSSHLHVDHIEPHRGDSGLFWDQNNLETLCRDCHAIDKRSHEERGLGAAQWFELLRNEMKLYQTKTGVEQCSELLPPRLANEILRAQST